MWEWHIGKHLLWSITNTAWRKFSFPKFSFSNWLPNAFQVIHPKGSWKPRTACVPQGSGQSKQKLWQVQEHIEYEIYIQENTPWSQPYFAVPTAPHIYAYPHQAQQRILKLSSNWGPHLDTQLMYLRCTPGQDGSSPSSPPPHGLLQWWQCSGTGHQAAQIWYSVCIGPVI